MSTPSSTTREEKGSGIQMQHVSERKFAARDLVSMFIGVVVLLGAFLAYRYVATRDDQNLSVRGTVFKTEVVSIKEDMARGLSGRDHIDRDAAMIFEFGKTERHCMWMKEMKFAIDITWLDESRKIVAIERNVTPETYPKTFCHDGRTVIELAAGTADHLPLYIGDTFRY
jgi:uncharacterized membrane protein (UPF0127 family)